MRITAYLSYRRIRRYSVGRLKRLEACDFSHVRFTRLDRIPKNPGFSLSMPGSSSVAVSTNEQMLMSQIREGMKKGEFTFFLQPIIDLNTRKFVAAEALVRWNHETLGILPPSAFIPILEKNGYITKMDTHIWELVCQTIRRWIDAGIRPVPIALNLSKTDILAMDIPGLNGMPVKA